MIHREPKSGEGDENEERANQSGAAFVFDPIHREDSSLSSPVGYSTRKAAIGVGSLIFVITFLVFSNAIFNGFVQWDDDTMVYHNKHIQQLSGATVGWMFTSSEYPPRYIPLSWLTYA